MVKTVLFDLDNTLLGNSMDTFLPQYFGLLAEFASREVGIEDFVPHVLKASEVLANNTDPGLTNSDVFWREMVSLCGISQAQGIPAFDAFYRHEFNQLKPVTTTWPEAADLVRTCFDHDVKVVIATNPMFPRTAVEARLEWADVPVSEFPYDLVTSVENMHAAKPHEAYYREILSKINCLPHETLMVGDDWYNDIEPAASVGLFTYWIQLPGTEPPDPNLPDAYGPLAQLLTKVESGWLQRLTFAA